MNATFSIVPATHTFTRRGVSIYSGYMLCELMAVEDELITRLCIERDGASGDDVHFLTGIIRQHEKDAAQLLALFERPATGAI